MTIIITIIVIRTRSKVVKPANKYLEKKIEEISMTLKYHYNKAGLTMWKNCRLKAFLGYRLRPTQANTLE